MLITIHITRVGNRYLNYTKSTLDYTYQTVQKYCVRIYRDLLWSIPIENTYTQRKSPLTLSFYIIG